MSLFHPIPVHLHDILVHCLRLWGSSLKGVSVVFPARLVCHVLWLGGREVARVRPYPLYPLHLAIGAAILHQLSTEVHSPRLLQFHLFYSPPQGCLFMPRGKGDPQHHACTSPMSQHCLDPIASPSLQTWCTQKHPTASHSPALTAWSGLPV